MSDAGGHIKPEGKPSSNWALHSYRIFNLVDNQVRALRKRQVIDSYKARPQDENYRKGAYWGIRTDITHYELADALEAPLQRTRALAAIPTRLASMDKKTQARLVNWGYAVCDAALRKHVDASLGPKPVFPYADGV